MDPAALALAVAALVVLLSVMALFLFGKKDKTPSSSSPSPPPPSSTTAPAAGSTAASKAKSSKKDRGSDRGGEGEKGEKGEKKRGHESGLLLATFKGHTEDTTDACFTPDGEHVLSSSLDRTLRRWPLSSLGKREHVCVRVGVALDHAVRVCYSADGKVLVAGLEGARVLRVHVCKDDKMVAKVDHLPEKAPSPLSLAGLGVAASERYKYLMTCYRDTTLQLWSFKGELLQAVDTKMGAHTYAALSPCGRFVGCCGFTPEVRLWEVLPGDAGVQARKAMAVPGLSAAALHFAFTPDSRALACVCSDRTWHVHNIDVRFELQQACQQLGTGRSRGAPHLVAVAPDALAVAVGCGREVELYDVRGGGLLRVIADTHAKLLTALGFDCTGKLLLTSGDRTVRVWAAEPAIALSIASLEKSAAAATGLAKERLEMHADALRKARDTLLDLAATVV